MKKIIVLMAVFLICISPLTVYAESSDSYTYSGVPVEIVEYCKKLYDKYLSPGEEYVLFKYRDDEYAAEYYFVYGDFHFNSDDGTVHLNGGTVCSLYVNKSDFSILLDIYYDVHEIFYGDMYLGNCYEYLYDPYHERMDNSVDANTVIMLFSSAAVISLLVIILLKLGVKKK